MVTNEKQKTSEIYYPNFLKTDKSWIDCRSLTKTGLPPNIDGPIKVELIKEH